MISAPNLAWILESVLIMRMWSVDCRGRRVRRLVQADQIGAHVTAVVWIQLI